MKWQKYPENNNGYYSCSRRRRRKKSNDRCEQNVIHSNFKSELISARKCVKKWIGSQLIAPIFGDASPVWLDICNKTYWGKIEEDWKKSIRPKSQIVSSYAMCVYILSLLISSNPKMVMSITHVVDQSDVFNILARAHTPIKWWDQLTQHTPCAPLLSVFFTSVYPVLFLDRSVNYKHHIIIIPISRLHHFLQSHKKYIRNGKYVVCLFLSRFYAEFD